MHPRAALVTWYVAAFGGIGAFYPYLALVLQDAGLSGAWLAAGLAAAPLGIITAGPLWGAWANTGARADVSLRFAGWMSAGGAAALLVPDARVATGALALIAVGRSAQMPLVDARALAALEGDRSAYGHVRLWGSVAFVLSVQLGGWLRSVWEPGPMALVALLWALATVSVRWLPVAPPAPPTHSWSVLAKVLPTLAPLLVVTTLHGVAMSTYDHLFSVLVESRGWSPMVIGSSVALGVVVEVGVMAAAPWLMVRLGPRVLVGLGLLAGVPRWLGTAWAGSAGVMVVVQGLHGLVYGAFWIGAVEWVARATTPGERRAVMPWLAGALHGLGAVIALVYAGIRLPGLPVEDLFAHMAWVSAAACLLAIPLLRPKPAG